MALSFQNDSVNIAGDTISPRYYTREFNCVPNNTFNVTLLDALTYYIYPVGQTFLITVVLPTIFAIGLLFNVAFIYVVVRIKHMRTVTNVYLINLAIADIVFLAAAIGDKLWKYAGSPVIGDDTPLGSIGCAWVYFLSDMSYFASLLFITVVSLDRYFAMCRPMDLDNVFKWKPKEIIIGSWILAFILAASLIPTSVRFQQYCLLWPDIEPYVQWPKVIGHCIPITSWMADFATGVQTIPFFVTLALNIYLYVLIVHTLNKWVSWRRILDHDTTKNNYSARTRHQITRMLVINGITFFALLAPFELLSLFQMIASLRGGNSGYIYIIGNDQIRDIMMFVSRILSYLNAAINPLIYTVMCRPYLAAFKQALLPTFCTNVFNNTYSIPMEQTSPDDVMSSHIKS